MMIQAQEKADYTPEEYLALESDAEERHEYLNGAIVPMVGGTPNHSLIIGNLAAALNFALKRQPYFVFASDQRLWIPQRKIYTYPDVMIVAGALQLQDGRKDTLINPVAIAEVLSNSTQAYDRGEKFKAYRTIPGFQEYVLIDQSSMHVEQYFKTAPRQWIFSEQDGETATLKLNTVPFELAFADLYDKVVFSDTAEQA
ncbi:Uma2 family endonuclease [Thermoleptolyngbya oregonensis]|uniref:Uma2 family endonuclease n=1 Tax=Thermoleptolyngbya oregonensis TaxID=2303529 RepID=UPI0029319774|nr:Uma2 family endonuclease [Thermoleptolyngbya oregonensis]